MVAPPRALPDYEIFNILLAHAGQKPAHQNPEQIFQQVSKEIAGYHDISYDRIGESGTQAE